MKKLTLSILSLIFLLCAAFGLVGCGKEKHTHSFTEQKVEQQYLASEATCTEGEKYYYSCKCGEKGTRIFINSDALGHLLSDWEMVGRTRTRKCLRSGCDYVESEKIPLQTSRGLSYSYYSNETCYITGIGTCSDTKIIIPEELDGRKVVSIGASAFANCKRITSIDVPDSVTYIGQGAFYGCDSLTSITLPFIGSGFNTNGEIWTNLGYIFGTTSYRDNSEYVPSTLKEISISNGSGVTSIGDGAFAWCGGLTSITIPDGVTSIGDSAFGRCSGLTSVTIPDRVTSIGPYAFGYCSGLTSVTIPDRVTSIGDHAFKDCSGLTSVTIGNGVTSIGNYAFDGCSGLTDVTIPDSVTSIDSYAFNGCSGLTSVTIGNGVTYIGNYAFYKCMGITSVTIGNSVTSIGDSAFYWCSRLTSITIPDSVTYIGDSAFV